MNRYITAVVMCLSLVFITTRHAFSSEQPPKLAVLIGCSLNPGEAEIHNDLTSVYNSLVQKNYTPDEIMTLEGRLTASRLKSFLMEAHERVIPWQNGQVFLYYSGHGYVNDTTGRPELWFEDRKIDWQDVFTELGVPKQVSLVLLPDC